LEYVISNADRLRRPAMISDKTAAREREAQALRDQLAKFAARAAEMNVDDYLAAVNPMRAKLAELDKASVSVSGAPATVTLLNSDDVRATWALMSVAGRRDVLCENISRIVIGRALRGRADAEMHNVRILDRDGIEIRAVAGYDPEQPSETHSYPAALADNMPSMPSDVAKRVSAAIFPR
jgi:hypothetical protein